MIKVVEKGVFGCCLNNKNILISLIEVTKLCVFLFSQKIGFE